MPSWRAGSVLKTLAAVAVGGSVWFFLRLRSGIGERSWQSRRLLRVTGAPATPELIGRYTRQGIYLGDPLCDPGHHVRAQTLVLPLLDLHSAIDPEFRDITVGYTKAITLGAPAMFIVSRPAFHDRGNRHVTKPIMYVSVFSLFCQRVPELGLHVRQPRLRRRMGAVGLRTRKRNHDVDHRWRSWLIAHDDGVSSTRSSMNILARLSPPRPQVLKEIIVLGVPIAVTITAEAGLFNAISMHDGYARCR